MDLQARHAAHAEAIEAIVLRVLRSGRWIGGPVVAEAEAHAARIMGRAHAVGVSSGTDALALALQALGVGPGHEVIVPALTFFATAGAVCLTGAHPVVVDVTEDGLLDVEAARAARTARTAAVIPVHLFGSRAPYPALGVPVVDDAAQAVGAAPSVAMGTLTALSAYPTKTWGAAGDAGFVVGDDPALLERVRQLGGHGATAPHLHEAPGGVVGRNARLDTLQAAILLAHAPHLEATATRRRALAALYDAGLPPGIRPLPRSPGSTASPYTVLVEGRDQVRASLAAQGIETAVYYPRSLAQQPALAPFEPRPTPVADHLCARLLSLPLHDSTTEAQVRRVLQALRP